MNDGDQNRPASDNGPAPVTLSDRVRSRQLAQRGAARAPRPSKLPWVLCAVLLLSTAAFGYQAFMKGGPPKDAGPTGDARGDVTGDVAASGAVVLQSKGYVVPVHPIQVSPKVGGMLVWVHPKLEEGRIFNKDDVLARVEDVDYRAERDQAKFALAAAEMRLEERKRLNKNWETEVQQAKKDLEGVESRLKLARVSLEAGEKAGTAIPRLDLMTLMLNRQISTAEVGSASARLALKKSEPIEERLQTAEAEVKAATALLAKAQWRLDNCAIKAPIAGMILTKKAEAGNIVNPAAFSSGISASLCDMADLRDLEVDVAVQERDIASVYEGQECRVMPEAYQNHKPFLAKHPHGYKAKVSRLMPTADRAKGAIPVRVRINPKDIPPEEAGKFLRPDTGALVSFLKDGGEGKE